MFGLLVYKYELLNSFLPILLHSCIRETLCISESEVEPERDGERVQSFGRFCCCTKAIQVYLKNTFSCEQYANALDILNVQLLSALASFTLSVHFTQSFSSIPKTGIKPLKLYMKCGKNKKCLTVQL